MTDPVNKPELISMDVSASVDLRAPRENVFRFYVNHIDRWLRGYPEGQGLDLIMEPYAGGRVYRDLPGGASVWWGTMQIYRPPERIDFAGPLFVDGPSLSHVRTDFLELDERTTRVRVHHRTMGETPAHPELAHSAWTFHLENLAKRAVEA